MKIVVFGGRDFTNRSWMLSCLVELQTEGIITPDVELLCGRARGADNTAYDLFKEAGANIHEFPADWEFYGKRAGFVRNKEMAALADVGLGFWDGKSKGTKHMIDEMKRLNKPLYVVRYDQRYG